MGRFRSRLFHVVLLLAVLAFLRPVPPTAHAQGEVIRYLRYDVEITVREDGTLGVRELQTIEFNDRFHTAFAEIPLALVGGIQVTGVSEEDDAYQEHSFLSGPGTYTVEPEPDAVFVQWEYEDTAPGDVKTFVLAYDVEGSLWVYDDGDVLEWRAVPADRSGFPVLASTVTVALPEPVPPDALSATAFGPAHEIETSPTEVRFTATEPIPDGTRFQVQVGFPHGLVAAERQPWQIREDSAALALRVPSYEVDLTVRPDGTLGVEERQRVQVEAGALYGGSRDLSLRFLDDLSNVAVFEGDEPLRASLELCEGCFQVEETRPTRPWATYDPVTREVVTDERRFGEWRVRWQVPPLVRGEATTFRLRYDAAGAIVADEAGQRFAWTVAYPDRPVPFEAATLTLRLPPGVAADAVQVDGGTVVQQSENTLTLSHEGPVPPQRSWEVEVRLPPGATVAPTPRWVQQVAAAREEAATAATRLARRQLGFGLAGLLLLVGGLTGVGLAWYRWGRDEPVPLAADYLSEPPSDLAPGLVAYLLDEEATPRGALASLFHLATLGLLRVQVDDPIRLQRNWDGRLEENQPLARPDGEPVVVPGHLVTLFNALAPHLEQPARLTTIHTAFQGVLPAVYYQMGQEAQPYFAEKPAVARHRWLSWGQGLVLGGVLLLGFLALTQMPTLGWVALLPALALVLVGGALMLISGWMPQRTPTGAEEAERWRAFRRYLLHLKTYGSLEEAQAVLDDHFAYAVALGVEDVVLAQAEALGGYVPVWTLPRPLSHRPPIRSGADREPEPLVVGRPAPGRPGARPTLSLPDPPSERPSLQGLSDQLSHSIQSGSDGLASLLNRSVGEAGETPFRLLGRGAGQMARLSWDATVTTGEVLGKILEAMASSSGGGGGGYSGGSTRRSSRSSFGSSRSGRSSRRSSSSRRSGGGGRRGFG